MLAFAALFVPISYYLILLILIALPAVGVSWGQGLVGRTMSTALDLQPDARSILNSRIFIIGNALTETAAILATVVSLLVLFKGAPQTLAQSLSFLGVFFAMTLPATIIGFLASLPVRQTLMAAARQPLFAHRIANLFLLIVSLALTPIVFGFLISMILVARIDAATDLLSGLAYLAGGAVLGLGSIGPAIGTARLGTQACQGAGTNREAYSPIFSYTFISAAIIETPILFALVVAIILIFVPFKDALLTYYTLPLAAATTAIPTIMVGISTGRTARAACTQIALRPELYPTLLRMSLICQALTDANAIYGLIISVIMLFVFL
ncbi:MAG: ATP synthase F0 subunit C [Candidatus Dependentiae bacterium]|nr:ATP synthase F0 subunit C [Candidatus Dependentiae bacterium]